MTRQLMTLDDLEEP